MKGSSFQFQVSGFKLKTKTETNALTRIGRIQWVASDMVGLCFLDVQRMIEKLNHAQSGCMDCGTGCPLG